MNVFEIDRKAQGTPQPFSEPPATARYSLPELDKALAKLDKLRDRQNALFIEVARLRDGLSAARQLDREALATAAAAGEPSPPLAAEAAEADDRGRQPAGHRARRPDRPGTGTRPGNNRSPARHVGSRRETRH